MKKIILLFCFLLTIFEGCVYYAVKTKDNPEYKTTINGRLHYQRTWRGRTPVLIFKGVLKNQLIYGEILEKTNDGILFYPHVKYPSYDTQSNLPKRVYKFDEIQCLIDSNSNILYGDLPEKYVYEFGMEFQAIRIDSLDAEPIHFKIEPNKEFSYCMEPGSYKVISIIFSEKYNLYDIAKEEFEEFPKIVFDVIPDKNNYIGDIYLDSLKDNNATKIRSKIGERPGDWSYYSGMLGYMAKEVSRADIRIDHYLSIKDESKTNDSVRVSLIKIVK